MTQVTSASIAYVATQVSRLVFGPMRFVVTQ
jgi:hypothetical protein